MFLEKTANSIAASNESPHSDTSVNNALDKINPSKADDNIKIPVKEKKNSSGRQNSKENKLISEDLMRNSIQMRKMNASDMLVNKNKKRSDKASREKSITEDSNGNIVMSSYNNFAEEDRGYKNLSQPTNRLEDIHSHKNDGKKNDPYYGVREDSIGNGDRRKDNGPFFEGRLHKRSITEDFKFRTNSLSLDINAAKKKSKDDKELSPDSPEKTNDSSEMTLRLKSKSKSVMPENNKYKHSSFNPMLDSRLSENSSTNFKISKVNEEDRDHEIDRIKNNPLLEREQLRRSIMIAKQKNSTDEDSFFAGSKLSAEIFRHLKESSNQSYLNILKKDEKTKQTVLLDETQKKFYSQGTQNFLRGSGASNKKMLSSQNLSSMKKYFLKEFVEKTQDTFDKTLDPNSLIFNQLAPSALASYRWRSTSTRNRVMKMRSQSPTVRYTDEVEDQTAASPPLLNIDKVIDNQDKRRLNGNSGFIKQLKSKFFLNSSFSNNDYFDFILQLIEDNHEIFGMKFTDYNDIIDFMKLDQSKGLKADVLEAHETMNYIKMKKEQFDKESLGEENQKENTSIKQANFEFFPVPPKKAPPSGLTLKTNNFRQGLAEIESAPYKPGSANNRDKDTTNYNINSEKKNSGITNSSNFKMFGGVSARKNLRSQSKDNK